MILNARNVLLVHEWQPSTPRVRFDVQPTPARGTPALKGPAAATSAATAIGTVGCGGASTATTMPTAVFEPEEYERWDGLS